MKPILTHKIDKERTLVGIECNSYKRYALTIGKDHVAFLKESDKNKVIKWAGVKYTVMGKFSEVTEQMAKEWGFGFEILNGYMMPALIDLETHLANAIMESSKSLEQKGLDNILLITIQH